MQSHCHPAFVAYDQAFKSATRPSRNLQLCLSTTQLTSYHLALARATEYSHYVVRTTLIHTGSLLRLQPKAYLH
jgi:hypothetical protein